MKKLFILKGPKPSSCYAKNYAFSLVEMLMALLVASLLLAALAPVMTKKMNETVNFEGIVPNPTKKRVVYLTEPGEGEWVVPNGIRSYKVTAVGAGGGGGAGSNYGCAVFTTTSTPEGSLLGTDADYCTHVRTDSSTNFTIPEGVNEIYVSMISGGGGGGAGSAEYKYFVQDTSTTWTVPSKLKGDRIYVAMVGAGGGGGGVDQGGGGGGAAGALNGNWYNIAIDRSSIPIVIGKGGIGGYYYTSPGAGGAGYKNGENGVLGAGGGGGGSTSFDNGAITARGGGGGGGQCIGSEGWASGNIPNNSALLAWKTVFNTGGTGRTGGYCGPFTYNGVTYGGKSGGDGGEGGYGVLLGGNVAGSPGANGTAVNASTGVPIYGAARGGAGGSTTAGTGNGGWGQDYGHASLTSSDTNKAGGGAGGGGGGSRWGAGGSAPTGCRGPWGANGTPIAKAEVGAGGAGASCGWNTGGSTKGGEGGDGRVIVHYLEHKIGGTGGQAGVIVPRTHLGTKRGMVSITPGNVITVVLGKGGKGGDRAVLADVNVINNTSTIGTINQSGVITGDTLNANGQPGSASYIKFGEEIIATTGNGSCGGGYGNGNIQCENGVNCGTRRADGHCANTNFSWHGNQSASCWYNHAGTADKGGASTTPIWDGDWLCGSPGGELVAGNFSARNGLDGSAGHGGSGSYYGGYGGKGGDGYVKIEWGIPRNLDHTKAEIYSGGGGSAGETVTKRITVSAVTNKIKYRIGEGGAGGSYNTNNHAMNNGLDGGDTSFGINGNYGFDTIKAKGGKGGNSVFINSTWGDSYFDIATLTGIHGIGGIAQCYLTSNCNDAMNGLAGENNKGGAGGASSTGIGGNGGSGTNINGFDAVEFNGTRGGGAGGGGGISAKNEYGRGGRGSHGYIKIEYDD